jgi:hypothetical protein
VTDPAVHARLTALQDRLGKPTPAPLDGQEAIDLTQPPDDPEKTATRPSLPVQQPLW